MPEEDELGSVAPGNAPVAKLDLSNMSAAIKDFVPIIKPNRWMWVTPFCMQTNNVVVRVDTYIWELVTTTSVMV
jgi:hypothetical protein